MSFRSYRREVKQFLSGTATKKVTRIGTEVTNHIKQEMRKKKSGEEYPIPGTGSTGANGRTEPGSKKTYIASAPGEYPAIRTGQLRSEVKFKVHNESDGVAVSMGTNVLQGIVLEGTEERPGIRPWLSKALEELDPRISQVLEKWE